MNSSLGYADIYGFTGPRQGAGVPMPGGAERSASKDDLFEDNKPAVFWLVLVGALIAVRWLWEKGG